MVAKKKVTDNTILQKMMEEYLVKLYDDINIDNVNLNDFPSLVKAMITSYIKHKSDMKFGDSLTDNNDILFAFNELDEIYGEKDFDVDIYRADD